MPGANSDEQKKENQPGADDKSNPPPKDPPAGSGDDKGDDEDLGDFADPKKALAEIKKLRQENAQRRTGSKELETKYNALNAKMERLSKALGGEDEKEADPEVKMTKLQAQVEQLEVERSIMQLSREMNIPLEHDDYFRFLLQSKMASLEEGEELGEEELAEIQAKVQAVSGAPKKSGTGAGGGNKPNGDEKKSGVTLDQFKKMTTLEKSDLYAKDPDAYTRLSAQARAR